MTRIVLCVFSAAIVAACAGGSAGSGAAPGEIGGERANISRARAATTPFRVLDAAVAEGYAATVANCVANGSQGAMGFHHTNRALLDDKLEIERPEMLVYERMGDGSYVLNGVEYIVPYSAHPRDAEPPSIMDHQLKRADGLQLWYLHVWLWKENTNGMFADWNPAVECRS